MSESHHPPSPACWLADPLDPAVSDTIDRSRRLRGVKRIAVMPDVHLAHGVCVGSVIATDELIYPTAVGGDIGCGMAAIAFDADANRIDDRRLADDLLDALRCDVPIHRFPRARSIRWLDRTALASAKLDRVKRREGPVQLGTLGRGNHFVELQRDEADGRLWLMVHSGSRGVGQAIRDHYVAEPDGVSFDLPYLRADGPAGRAYLHDAGWARAFAELSRQAMVFAVAARLRRMIGVEADASTYIRTDHNHVRRERHGGVWLWVHRKGAAPADRGRLLVIPGSMGTVSFHAVGRGCAGSLRSSSHGAGRSMSRDEARRRVSDDAFDRQMRDVRYDRRMRRRLVDEAPGAYRDVDRVMRAQRELVTIRRRMRPVIVYKG